MINNISELSAKKYYAFFHGVRALVYRLGYREENHSALKLAFKELYIKTDILLEDVYIALERGMNLREMADYKENYSQFGASNLIEMVVKGLAEIEKELEC